MNPLTNILPIPLQPLEVPTADDWARAEAVYGPLPTDYRRFLHTYGSGYIDRFMVVLNPASPNKYVNLLTRGAAVLDAMCEVQKTETWPYVFHPAAGGLVPAALTDNGDMIFWRTVGAPDGWPIVVIESRGPETQEFAMTMSRFLAQILQRSLTCKLFPSGFPSAAPTFEPFGGAVGEQV